MRMAYLLSLTAAAVLCLTSAAMAQSAGNGSVPSAIGNRANGRDYQPTPSEVVPREKAAGLRPSDAQQQATDQQLEKTDRQLLRSEGLSTKSVPNIAPNQ